MLSLVFTKYLILDPIWPTSQIHDTLAVVWKYIHDAWLTQELLMRLKILLSKTVTECLSWHTNYRHDIHISCCLEVPDSGPELTGISANVSPGQFLSLNCSSHNVIINFISLIYKYLRNYLSIYLSLFIYMYILFIIYIFCYQYIARNNLLCINKVYNISSPSFPEWNNIYKYIYIYISIHQSLLNLDVPNRWLEH